jgi:hypothetical protein
MSDDVRQYHIGVEQEALLVRRPNPAPLSAEDQRSRAVEMKLRELAAEHGLDMDHPEAWGSTECRLRDRLLSEAEAAVPGSRKTTLAGPREYQFDEGLDPLAAVAEAKATHAEAIAALETAGDVFDRATDRLTKAEADLASYDGLDDRVEDWTVQRLKEGRSTDLSLDLKQQLVDRARARDRVEIARGAHTRLARELHDAEIACQSAERVARAAATAYLMHHAESMADDLIMIEAEAVKLRSILHGFASASLPGLHGVFALSPKITRALNEPMGVAQPDPKAIALWRQRHSDVLTAADPVEAEEPCKPLSN